MQSHLDKALQRCFFYLKYRPRTEREIYNYLFKNSRKYKLNQKDIFEIIKHLKELGYLNDIKFIEWFVAKRTGRKPKATFLIKSELKTYGIKEEIIRNYFEKNEINEKEIALKALNYSKRKFIKIQPEERKNKEIMFLISRGFGYGIARSAVEEFNEKD